MSKPIKLICSSLLLLLSGCTSTADKETEDLKRELSQTKSETSILKNELNSLKNMAPPVKSTAVKDESATTGSGTIKSADSDKKNETTENR